MIGPIEVVLILLLGGIVLGPPIISLVAMRRTGKAWARVRLTAYSITAVLYAINAIVIFSRGNGAGGGTSAIIAFFAGKGALEAFRAWRQGDYRPAYLRAHSGSTAREGVDGSAR